MSVARDIAARAELDWAGHPTLSEVRIVASEKVIDTPRVPTVILRQTSIGRCPELPLSHRNVGVLLTIVSPHQDMDKAGEQLFSLVDAILDYLDRLYAHEDATQVAYLDRLAYDIPLTAIAAKDK